MTDDTCEVLTMGHAARPVGEFIALLVAHGITHVVDVRRVPRVRLVPGNAASRKVHGSCID